MLGACRRGHGLLRVAFTSGRKPSSFKLLRFVRRTLAVTARLLLVHRGRREAGWGCLRETCGETP
eukprot:4172648-Amphidinium_carterae.1